MNETSIKLMRWMSLIDFDLLDRVDNPSCGVRARPWRVWIPVAAALLLVALLLPTAIIGHQTEIYVEENYEHYDGTVLHMMDIMLTQDENTFTELLGESGTEKLHAMFVALRKALYPDMDLRFSELPVYPMTRYRGDDSYAIAKWWEILEHDAYRLGIPEKIDGLPVDSIVPEGFRHSFKLQVAEIPGSVKRIEYWAFDDCPDLEKVRIEHGVEVISESAFSNCPALKEVILPNSLTYLSFYLFYDCPSLTEITYMGTIEEWNAIEKYQAPTLEDPDCPWHIGSSIKVVHCTDGDIAVGE